MAERRRPVLDTAERPAAKVWLPLSLQHLFAMFGATVLVPFLTGLPAEVALVTSGLGTLLFMAVTGGRVPAYLGSSFAFIAPLAAGAQVAGPAGALFGAFCAGGVYVLVALAVRLFGVGWLARLLPPVVVGPVIMVIGLGLASVAVGMAQNTVGGGSYSLPHFAVALATLAAVLLFSLILRGFFAVVPILLGIAAGYLVALAAGLVDLAPVIEAPFLRWPRFDSFVDLLANQGVPWAVLPILVPVAIVTIAEHIGDMIVLSRVTERDFLTTPGFHRTLAGDGLATMLAALLGGPPNTTYGENIGVLAITRIFSVWVVAGAACLAIALGFVGTLSAFLASIPSAVIGGVAIALFGVIASSGIRTLIEGRVDFGEKRNLLVASVILVIGIGGASLRLSDDFTVSSMALAAVLGVLLHAILPDKHLAGEAVFGRAHG